MDEMLREGNLKALFDRAVERSPEAAAIHYFDGCLSYAELNEQSSALANHLRTAGMVPGDRLLICLQNVPDFVVGLVTAIKLGAISVPVNPMYRAHELALLIDDCRPFAMICHDELAVEVLPEIRAEAHYPPRLFLTVSPHDRQTEDPAILPPRVSLSPFADVRPMRDIVGQPMNGSPEFEDPKATDIAMLVYTSGTTGRPKGAVITHRNMVAGVQFYHQHAELDGSPILGMAPLFHVTGLSGHIFAAISAAAPLILCYRFEPGLILEAISRHQPAFTVGAITALVALAAHPLFSQARLSSFKVIMSGGAPIPPAIHKDFLEKSGISIRNVYGLTETCAPVIAVPKDAQPPVDRHSGALSIGKVIPGTEALVSKPDDDGQTEGQGELILSGPSVISSYWQKPEETAQAMRESGFHTGDIAVRDSDGWYYIVDRKKDMIIASGFKIWPREVEDVLYCHPAVREAAVVGVPDSYRGETVLAVVSVKSGATVSSDELIQFCKGRLAAYKYPRLVEIVDDLPKTLTGKIMRAALRPQGAVKSLSSPGS